MKNSIPKLLVPALLALIVGCGPEAAEHSEGDGYSGEDGHEEHGAEESGASFKEGKGIRLSDEATKALEVTVEDVTTRKLKPSVKVTAQVYRTARETGGSEERSGFACASAFVDSHVTEKLKAGETVAVGVPSDPSGSLQGTLKKVDNSLVASTDKAEVLIEIPDPENLFKMGAFITVELPETAPPQEVVAVPFPAVLDTAAGKFAYVKNGGFLLRTPVQTGPAGGEFVEITEGLYEGDTVVITGAEALYLIELRATKGGGHSH